MTLSKKIRGLQLGEKIGWLEVEHVKEFIRELKYRFKKDIVGYEMNFNTKEIRKIIDELAGDLA